ncbi:Reverse transcriptase domain-containing protein [Mycena chlorophos]|uniref:Reverse transcriptase domain-containing protein n=1 Tax=Mycena chlorophos TaxID=658473 RepID=A0A8H6WB09_MYCCL|nr:Reverse transcriptase domain-containing protein [Mycena chlorophos]
MRDDDDRPRPALEALPLELWDCIVAFADDLFHLCQTCKTLNTLAIEHALLREGVSLTRLLEGNVIWRPTNLWALFLYPAATLPTKKLVFDLAGGNLHDFRHAVDGLTLITRRAPHLRDLKIIFPDPDNHMWHDIMDTWAMTALCVVLSTAAERNSGPVLVFTSCFSRTAFTCWPRDIAEWRLPEGRFNPPKWVTKTVLGLKTRKGPDKLQYGTSTRCHDGQSTQTLPLSDPTSVHLRLTNDGESLLLFNASEIRHFFISDADMASSAKALFHVFLESAQLPMLERLDVYAISHPAAFGKFLVNHPGLQRIWYHGQKTSRAVSPVFSPPLSVAHPGLLELCLSPPHPTTKIPSGFVPGLHLSPQLRRLGLHFYGSPVGGAGATFLEELRCLVERPRALAPLTLELVLHGRSAPLASKKILGIVPRRLGRAQFKPSIVEWPNLTPNPEVATLLDCVDTVELSVESLNTARSMLPWVAALPNLGHVDFFFHLGSRGRPSTPQSPPPSEILEFLEDAQAVLRPATQVSHSSS